MMTELFTKNLLIYSIWFFTSCGLAGQAVGAKIAMGEQVLKRTKRVSVES